MTKKRLVAVAVILTAAFAGGWLYAGRADSAAGVRVVVYQNPSCGCCGQWAEHMRDAGFDVEVNKVSVNPIKRREGITPQIASCHTAFVDGYVIEGHVPARDIRRLLSERPEVKGLAVPGMPMGSPGMEGAYRDSYDVLTWNEDGTTSVYASY